MLIEDAGAWCPVLEHEPGPLPLVHCCPLLPPPPLQPTAAPRWVFRANFPKAIYQSVQSYSPQPSSYIFSSPGWGGERRCQEIGEAASRSTGAWPFSATRGYSGIMSRITWIFSSYLSIRHLLHQHHLLLRITSTLHVLLIWTHHQRYVLLDIL